MEMKQRARMKALEKMREKSKKDRMSGMEDKLGDLKKVTVMSDSEEGMEKGLDMAEKIMKAKLGEGVTEDEPLLGEEFKKKKKQ